MQIVWKFSFWNYRYNVFMVLLLLTSACGGGATSPVSPPIPPFQDDQTEAEMRASNQLLLNSFTTPVIYTPISSVPTIGNANYRGYYFGVLSNSSDNISDNLIGQLSIQIAFDAVSSTFSGAVENILDENNAPLMGAINILSGSFDRTGNPQNGATIAINASGVLTDSEGNELLLNSQLQGDFLGQFYSGMGGDVFGRVTVDGAKQDIDGGFIAARQ